MVVNMRVLTTQIGLVMTAVNKPSDYELVSAGITANAMARVTHLTVQKPGDAVLAKA